MIDYIKNLSFSYEDIDYLRGLHIFDEDFLEIVATTSQLLLLLMDISQCLFHFV